MYIWNLYRSSMYKDQLNRTKEIWNWWESNMARTLLFIALFCCVATFVCVSVNSAPVPQSVEDILNQLGGSRAPRNNAPRGNRDQTLLGALTGGICQNGLTYDATRNRCMPRLVIWWQVCCYSAAATCIYGPANKEMIWRFNYMMKNVF